MEDDERIDLILQQHWDQCERWLLGGPCDGLCLPDRLKAYGRVSVEYRPGWLAIYAVSDCRYRFVEVVESDDEPDTYLPF